LIKVFMLDKSLRAQDLVHPAVARILLSERKARVHRAQPFCIRLGVVSSKVTHGLQLKLDPGSKTTGIALVSNESGEVVWGAELTHHGQLIKKRLEKRAAQRHARRARKTRYRPARFLNRTKPKGWLPPSLEHRLGNVMTFVHHLRKLAQITGISLELVKFDMQAMQNPEVSGILYQQGELAGYEMREYLLEKFNRTCVYCGAKNVPLQVEHVVPKAVGGSNRISNLTLACDACNKAKGTLPIEEFLKGRPALLKKIKAQLKTPLKDAAAVNATRWELWRRLAALGLPVECGSGALTKFNRTKQGLPKAHWLDAACVGKSTPSLKPIKVAPLYIKSYGRGSRQVWQTDAFGFPKRPKAKEKIKFGFRTGDWVKAIVPKGKLQGTHIGRLTTRARPSFTLGKADGINPKHIVLLQRNDGYEYSYAK
jgi:5-methylcytosine-specific restriction endonuclease McrA